VSTGFEGDTYIVTTYNATRNGEEFYFDSLSTSSGVPFEITAEYVEGVGGIGEDSIRPNSITTQLLQRPKESSTPDVSFDLVLIPDPFSSESRISGQSTFSVSFDEFRVAMQLYLNSPDEEVIYNFPTEETFVAGYYDVLDDFGDSYRFYFEELTYIEDNQGNGPLWKFKINTDLSDDYDSFYGPYVIVDSDISSDWNIGQFTGISSVSGGIDGSVITPNSMPYDRIKGYQRAGIQLEAEDIVTGGFSPQNGCELVITKNPIGQVTLQFGRDINFNGSHTTVTISGKLPSWAIPTGINPILGAVTFIDLYDNAQYICQLSVSGDNVITISSLSAFSSFKRGVITYIVDP
jgi:hypothetical protein